MTSQLLFGIHNKSEFLIHSFIHSLKHKMKFWYMCERRFGTIMYEYELKSLENGSLFNTICFCKALPAISKLHIQIIHFHIFTNSRSGKKEKLLRQIKVWCDHPLPSTHPSLFGMQDIECLTILDMLVFQKSLSTTLTYFCQQHKASI